jgi:hypothetical protein
MARFVGARPLADGVHDSTGGLGHLWAKLGGIDFDEFVGIQQSEQ